MEHGSLLQCSPYRAMQAVFEVQVSLELDDVRKQVTKERGVLGEQRLKVERALRGDQLSEPNLAGRQARPLRHAEAMVGVRALVANCLKNHSLSILRIARSRDSGDRCTRAWVQGAAVDSGVVRGLAWGKTRDPPHTRQSLLTLAAFRPWGDLQDDAARGVRENLTRDRPCGVKLVVLGDTNTRSRSRFRLRRS